jgi:hypothetical protein
MSIRSTSLVGFSRRFCRVRAPTNWKIFATRISASQPLPLTIEQLRIIAHVLDPVERLQPRFQRVRSDPANQVPNVHCTNSRDVFSRDSLPIVALILEESSVPAHRRRAPSHSFFIAPLAFAVGAN